MILKNNLFTSVFLLFLLVGVISCKKDEPIEREVNVDIKEEAKLDESVVAVIPHIYINIAGAQDVVSKDDYLRAEINIEGNGKFTDLPLTLTNIKGRGNSTWNKPKKPYRLKLDAKRSILGLPEAKDWVLLANFQDYTLMTNAVAMKIGQFLGLPFTNTIIPVDVTVNGVYKGNYNLTQQVEISEDRVNVGDDGVLLEIDKNFDENFQFISSNFKLPVMVKDPDMESVEQFNIVKSEFKSFEDLLAAPNFPNNNYGSQFDKKQLVNYLIINNLAGNLEINHPKSVYIHKAKGGKYTMGPIWDFDWGFGMDEDSRIYFNSADLPLLRQNEQRLGGVFFSRFLKDPEVRALYKQQWKSFREQKFEPLMQYIEEYAALIRESKKRDFETWKHTYVVSKVHADNNLPQSKADLKTYLRKRAKYIDAYVNSL